MFAILKFKNKNGKAKQTQIWFGEFEEIQNLFF